MQAYNIEKIKELVYPPPNIVRCNFFVTLQQSDSSVEEKVVS